MNKSEYALLLQDPRWNIVRVRILKRDLLVCRECGIGNCKLNVHHKRYVEGALPWEVADKYLITLCDNCHSKAHEKRVISSFTRKKGLRRDLTRKPPKSKIWVEGIGLVEAFRKK